MEKLKEYKWPLITLFSTIIVLILMLSIGYSLGFLSENPDGLERVLEDVGHEGEGDIWTPILSWIENNYLAGIIGIVLITLIVIGFFYLNKWTKMRK
ncbi:MAG: hypothetical protein JXA99_01360 [Candidatus Lokiarchaeota archaeon]|nr:hypothetical protein [Candidatus Lokiarchaeota archaeon]